MANVSRETNILKNKNNKKSEKTTQNSNKKHGAIKNNHQKPSIAKTKLKKLFKNHGAARS